jgi:uncharacterized protein (UPF0333 family)
MKLFVRDSDTKRQKGSALLEFSFVLPFLLVFVVGLIEFGRGFNISHNVTNACREGTRQATQQDSNQITLTSANHVRDRVVSYMNSLGLQTTYYTGTGVLDTTTTSPTDYIYGSRSGAYLLVDQGEVIEQRDANGNVIPGGNYYLVSKVEIRYPYTFPLFGRVIKLLGPSSAYTGTFYIKNSAIMEN